MSLLTPPPDPPSRADPANFAARGDAFFDWFETFVAEFNAHIPTGLSGIISATTLSASGTSTLAGHVVVGAAFDPSEWAGGRKAIEFAAPGNALYGAAAEIALTQNYYHDGSHRFGGTGYAQFLKESAAGLEWYASSASGSAGGAATMVKRFGVDLTGIAAGLKRLAIDGGADASFVEFSRNGFTAKGSVGVLGGFEMNISSNMDYTTGVHRFYDPEKAANWIAMDPDLGIFFQYAPATEDDGDVWNLGGQLYNGHLDNDGNLEVRGHLSAAAGMAAGSELGHSDWVAGRAIELGSLGCGVWGVTKNTYVTSNTYFDGASKFAAAGYASHYEQALGGHGFYSSNDSGVADATAVMVLNMLIKQDGGVQMAHLPAYVSGDKYVTMDSSGNLHQSAVGPGS